MARILVLLLLSATAFGDTPAAVEIPDGATLAIRLEKTVKADRPRAGDMVRATLLAPVLSRGQILIPQSATIRGRVLLAEGRHRGTVSRLLVRFESAEWRGNTAVLNAYLVRQLLQRRSFSGNNGSALCGSPIPYENSRRRGGGVDPASVPPTRGSYGGSDSPCAQRPGLNNAADPDRLLFVSPPMKNVDLLSAVSPRGATVLVSRKKNVKMSAGSLFEIRHTATVNHAQSAR